MCQYRGAGRDQPAQAPTACVPAHTGLTRKIGFLARDLGILALTNWYSTLKVKIKKRLAGWVGWGERCPLLPGEAGLQTQESAQSQMVLSGTPGGRHLHCKTTGDTQSACLRETSRY